MQNTVTKGLEALKKSVTFAMSLGAKELFHTNFIAFLLENDDSSLFGIRQNLGKLFGITINAGTKVYTWREKYNLDLVIIAIGWNYSKMNYSKIDEDVCDSIESCDSVGSILNAQVCVIEAKLKSLPTLDQLIGYDKKLETTRGLNFYLNDYDYLQWNMHGQLTGFKLIYDQGKNVQTLRPIYGTRINNIHIINPVVFEKILLSQVTLPICKCTSPICTCTPAACKWTQKNWNDIVEAIQAGIVSIKSSNAVLITVIKDYIDHLENLARLITGVITYSQQKFTTPSAANTLINYIAFCNGINGNGFKALRIHDLVGKVVFNDLEQRLVNAINILNALNPCQCNNLQFNHENFYSHQQPGINFEWFYKGNAKGKIFRIGVQIQGSDYRHYIATNTNWTGLKKLSVILSKAQNNWFFATINGKTLSGKKNNDLYKFSAEKFLYSKMPLDIEDFDQLSQYIKESMDLACGIMTKATSDNDLADYFK